MLLKIAKLAHPSAATTFRVPAITFYLEALDHLPQQRTATITMLMHGVDISILV
jgi:hypothetical protein